MNDIHNDIVTILKDSIKRNYAQSILLSGGLDSSCLAALAVELDRAVTAITVSLSDIGSDLEWADKVTKHLKIPWIPRKVSTEEALSNGLPWLVKVMRTFDLGIVNDLPYYYGMKEALERNFRSIMTGDGSDWLNGGYSFLWDKGDNYNSYVSDAFPHIPWSARVIAKELGIDLKQPYLDPNYIMLALSIPFSEKVKEMDLPISGDVAVEKRGSHDKRWGKVALREAMVNYFPYEILWRPKTDLEFGSGMSELGYELSRRGSDDKLRQIENQTGIRLYAGKSQIYLLELFLRDHQILGPKDGERACSYYHSGVPIERRHCETCGYFEETISEGVFV